MYPHKSLPLILMILILSIYLSLEKYLLPVRKKSYHIKAKRQKQNHNFQMINVGCISLSWLFLFDMDEYGALSTGWNVYC